MDNPEWKYVLNEKGEALQERASPLPKVPHWGVLGIPLFGALFGVRWILLHAGVHQMSFAPLETLFPFCITKRKRKKWLNLLPLQILFKFRYYIQRQEILMIINLLQKYDGRIFFRKSAIAVNKPVPTPHWEPEPMSIILCQRVGIRYHGALV